jgi:hypothetical protein
MMHGASQRQHAQMALPAKILTIAANAFFTIGRRFVAAIVRFNSVPVHQPRVDLTTSSSACCWILHAR